jgi:hypothetical protein
MSNQDPMRTFSRTVAGAIENSPEVEAFLAGNHIVPSTWGDYATHAIDLDLVDATPAAVVELFGGADLVDLADPAIQFESLADFNWYEKSYRDGRKSLYQAMLRPEAWQLEQTSRLIASQWEMPDATAARHEADRLQELIPEIEDEQLCASMCMRRDGLHDGVEVTLADYVTAMLGANVVDEDEPRELTRAWVSGVVQVVDEIIGEYGYADVGDMNVTQVYLEREHFDSHAATLRHAPDFIAHQLALADWQVIEPVFLAPTTLSIIEGNEQ